MERLPTTVVVPTVGRASLESLLDVLARIEGPRPAGVVVVDDRTAGEPLELARLATAIPGLVLRRSGGGGPARARNVGWRTARTPWVSFLDDDVIPYDDWYLRLARDLADSGPRVAGIQGRVHVPLPTQRHPTDWERSTSVLANAAWITADMTYRHSALRAVGGFDERFPRAYREDADLGLRVLESGGRLVTGERCIRHPVRDTDDWVSVRQQAGNADDVLMRRLHGPSWRDRAAAPRGRRRRHLATTAAGLLAVGAAVGRRPRLASVGAAGWLLGVGELSVARIAPGPRDRAEVLRMVLTSIVIPGAASWHTGVGTWRHRRVRCWHGPPELVLFDRDGTLVLDVPYNADPARVEPVAGAREALQALRTAGVRVGVVSNQSGVARGLITAEQLRAVNARVEELVGPFDVVEVCPHGSDDGCDCRKPAPGMVKAACERLGVPVERCAVVGDIGSDMEAAQAAGARGVLVPTPTTMAPEVAAATHVQPDLAAAVRQLLDGAA